MRLTQYLPLSTELDRADTGRSHVADSRVQATGPEDAVKHMGPSYFGPKLSYRWWRRCGGYYYLSSFFQDHNPALFTYVDGSHSFKLLTPTSHPTLR